MHSNSTPNHSHPAAELDQDAPPASPRDLRRRLALILSIVLVLLILAVVPPLINVSRYQRRVDRDISAALGRPVHFDKLSLSLFPLPGFTLENFVVEEDPAFGSEPILTAQEVRVTLRIGSLWRHRIEFSRISLAESSSVNLVHLANGRWNFEGLLLQASRIEAAPTAQRFAGSAPRFPYIEATGARLNLKLDQEKTPYSLTDADFALWLPEPHQWHLRLEAHPERTDTRPGDTGTLRLEGVLGGTGQSITALAQVPLDLHGSWHDAQLGGLTRLVTGTDAGLRGDLSVDFGLLGTVDRNVISAAIDLTKAHRADFVPATPLSIEASCQAVAEKTFHAFSSIECRWPPAGPSSLILTAGLPNVRRPRSSFAQMTVPALPAATLLDMLHIATPHPPTGLIGSGTLAGTLTWGTDPRPDSPANSAAADTTPPHDGWTCEGAHPCFYGTGVPGWGWSGKLELTGESLQIAALGPQPIPLDDIVLRSSPLTAQPTSPSQPARARLAKPQPWAGIPGFELMPIQLPLGGKEPAILEARFDANGYTLRLSGSAIPASLLALGDAIPQFGDGLKDALEPAPAGSVAAPFPPQSSQTTADPSLTEPVHIDLTATRAWGQPQTWRPTAPPPPHSHHRSGN